MGLTPERTAATQTIKAHEQSTGQIAGQTTDTDIQELLQRKDHVITNMGDQLQLNLNCSSLHRRNIGAHLYATDAPVTAMVGKPK